MDATAEIIRMTAVLDRQDVNAIMLNGCVIAWYNVINPVEVLEITGLPVICVSYKDSEGLTGHIRHHFPGDEERVRRYENLGERLSIPVKTGLSLSPGDMDAPSRRSGTSAGSSPCMGRYLNLLRVARLCARTVMQQTRTENSAIFS